MNLINHFLVSLFLSFVMIPFFGIYGFLIFVGGFLIDFDHWLFCVYYYGKFSLKDCYKTLKNRHIKKSRGKIFIFHTIEFFIIMVASAYFYEKMFIVFIGYVVHMGMDWYDEYSKYKEVKELSFIKHMYIK